MSAEPIAQRHALQKPPSIAVEARLLELFSPTKVSTSPVRNEHADLWRLDAIHRARNMAQMTMSLADVANHPSRRWLSPELTTQARQLSRAYKELGMDAHVKAAVPCTVLLTEIVSRLADLFGRARQIKLLITSEAVLLPADMRRALVLMASELVINALKYGYPTQAGGTIVVSLQAKSDDVELVVEDDGVGLGETYSPGQGGGLLEQLSVVIGATVTRTSGRKGHGLRISILVPAIG